MDLGIPSMGHRDALLARVKELATGGGRPWNPGANSLPQDLNALGQPVGGGGEEGDGVGAAAERGFPVGAVRLTEEQQKAKLKWEAERAQSRAIKLRKVGQPRQPQTLKHQTLTRIPKSCGLRCSPKPCP